MTEEEIKLMCAGVKVRKKDKVAVDSRLSVPKVMDIDSLPESAAKTDTNGSKRVDAYFAAMQDNWEE